MALRGEGAKTVREQVFVADKAMLTVKFEVGILLCLQTLRRYCYVERFTMPWATGKDQSHERWSCGFEPPSNGQTRGPHGRQSSAVPRELTLACFFALAHGRALALLSTKRCMDHVCISFSVPPTCTAAVRMTMRRIVKFFSGGWMLYH